MDIKTLSNPLRRLTLGFAFIVAILPAYFLVLLAFDVLTGREHPTSPKGLFVVAVLSGLSAFLFATYVLMRKTRYAGVAIAISLYSILIAYLGYKILLNIILRI